MNSKCDQEIFWIVITLILLLLAHYSVSYSSTLHESGSITHFRDICLRIVPRWRPVAILDLIETEIAQFDPCFPKTQPWNQTRSGSDDLLPGA